MTTEPSSFTSRLRRLMGEASASGKHLRGRRGGSLFAIILLVPLACAPPPPSIPPTPGTTPTSVASPTATFVPASPTPRPTLPPPATPRPNPTVDQPAIVSTVAAGAQELAPRLQATGAAIAPTVATVVAGIAQSEQTQETVRQVAALLGGIRLEVDQTPPGATPPETTRLVLRGSDTAGALASLEPFARRLTAQAALVSAGQLFPNATVELTVVDAGNVVVLRGSRQPGYLPEVSLGQ